MIYRSRTRAAWAHSPSYRLPTEESHVNTTTASRAFLSGTWIRVALMMFLVASASGIAGAEQGMYFAKKHYEPKPLPTFEATRGKLPAPIFEEDPSYVKCYWKAWELAFRNFHEPAPGSGFVSPFIDAAFNQNIFLWDTCFMTMFCNYAHPYVPGIGSLDNFYARQHEDGEICREINRTTGRDFEQWVNAKNEPLFSRWGYTRGHGAEARQRGLSGPAGPDAQSEADARRPESPDLRLGRAGELPPDRRQGQAAPGLRASDPVLRRPPEVPPPGQRPLPDRLGQHGQLPAQPLPGTGRHRDRYLLRDGPLRPTPRADRHDSGKGISRRTVPPGRRGACHAHQSADVGRAAKVLLRPDRRRASGPRSRPSPPSGPCWPTWLRSPRPRPSRRNSGIPRPSTRLTACPRWRPTSPASIPKAATGKARSGRRPTRW